MLKRGMGDSEIAKQVKSSRQTVRAIRLRNEAMPDECTQDIVASATRSGRPATVTTPVKKVITNHCEDKRGRSTTLAVKMAKKRGHSVSKTSVRRVLKAAGNKPYRVQVQPYLTDANKSKRVAFASSFSHKEWDRVLLQMRWTSHSSLQATDRMMSAGQRPKGTFRGALK